MTSPLLDVDFAALDLRAPCEWTEYECRNTAVVTSRGCSDDRSYAICQEHLSYRKRWFAGQWPATCECGYPALNFFQHYLIEKL